MPPLVCAAEKMLAVVSYGSGVEDGLSLLSADSWGSGEPSREGWHFPCPTPALFGDNWHLETFTPGLLPCLHFSLLLCAPPSRVDADVGFAFIVSYFFISAILREAAPASEGTKNQPLSATWEGSTPVPGALQDSPKSFP